MITFAVVKKKKKKDSEGFVLAETESNKSDRDKRMRSVTYV